MDIKLYKLADILINRAIELNEEAKEKAPKNFSEELEMFMKLSKAETLSEISLAIQEILRSEMGMK